MYLLWINYAEGEEDSVADQRSDQEKRRSNLDPP
jgi:hypothetical protein